MCNCVKAKNGQFVTFPLVLLLLIFISAIAAATAPNSNWSVFFAVTFGLSAICCAVLFATAEIVSAIEALRESKEPAVDGHVCKESPLVETAEKGK